MLRVYLRWPLPEDRINFVNKFYSRRTGREADYGVDEKSRWYIEVQNDEWFAALQLALHGDNSN